MLTEFNKILFILVTAILLLFSMQSQASPKDSGNLEPCMKASCVAYFEKWQSLAKRKHSRAMSGLAELYYQGYGTKKDLEMSFKYFRSASRAGFTYAHYRTALFYLNEEGFIDYERGVYYLRKASRAKNSESYFLLAVIYASNDLGIMDLDDADKYLAKAIAANHIKAQQYVELLSNHGKLDKESYPETANFLEKLNNESKVAFSSNTTENQVLANNNEIEWPKDNDIEVISVSAPSLEDTFDYELAQLEFSVPDAGFRQSIDKLRDCNDIPTCGTVQINGDNFNKSLYRNDFMKVFQTSTRSISGVGK